MTCCGFTVPKGYRFHPSDEELLSDLKEKNDCKDSQITTIIPEIEVCKYEPPQLPELAFTGAENLVQKFFLFFFFWITREESWHSQSKWYFFTPRDYKYTNSSRSNRTTGEGYWKITGKDRAIKAPGSKAVIGRKRTLTFYKRGVPKPQKTGWVIHEYFLIQESCDTPKQIGEYVVCCLKYKSDNSDHDTDAPFCNPGSRSCSMASNVENQDEENGASQELVCVPIPNDNDYEAENGGGMVTEGNPSNWSEMIDELLDDPPAPPQLDQPMYPADVHKQECRKRPHPFEHDDPSLPKKNNISTDDGNKLVSNSASNSENQAANVNPEGYYHPGANLESHSDSFLTKDYHSSQPSINGGPRVFYNYNSCIELDDLLPPLKGNDYSLAEFSGTVIDGGRRVTSDRNTLVANQPIEHGSENDFSPLASGASLHRS